MSSIRARSSNVDRRAAVDGQRFSLNQVGQRAGQKQHGVGHVVDGQHAARRSSSFPGGGRTSASAPGIRWVESVSTSPDFTTLTFTPRSPTSKRQVPGHAFQRGLRAADQARTKAGPCPNRGCSGAITLPGPGSAPTAAWPPAPGTAAPAHWYGTCSESGGRWRPAAGESRRWPRC